MARICSGTKCRTLALRREGVAVGVEAAVSGEADPVINELLLSWSSSNRLRILKSIGLAAFLKTAHY